MSAISQLTSYVRFATENRRETGRGIGDLSVIVKRGISPSEYYRLSMYESARSLGWDVAITGQGPLLLEMNSYVAIPVFQRMGHSVRHGVFKVQLDGN